ncbi:hypothetical protein MMC18_005639 [Xylographa bjoerkii]|nr:hypothetical protein [Xylographa bjoerkii]
MEDHRKKMHPGILDSISIMDQFPVTGACFETALSNPTANPSQQDLQTYDYSFLGPGNSAQIGGRTGPNPLQPTDVGLASSQSTSQGANYDYRDYIASNTFKSTILDDDTISYTTTTDDYTGRPSAHREPEAPIQGSFRSGDHHNGDVLRKRILELEDGRRRELLILENMDNELATLRKADELLAKSYTRS